MASPAVGVGGTAVLDRRDLDALLGALREAGYATVGPRLRDGAIVYDELASAADLPIGWTDEQEAGAYRLRRREDEAAFGYNVGPHSWKRFLYPSEQRLWTAHKDAGGFRVEPERAPPPRYAFVGVRACELRAIEIQDKVFMDGARTDPGYAARREGAFIVAVQCGQAGRTCFCVSMDCGPRASAGFDLALTELMDPHRFHVEIGSERGAAVARRLPLRPAEARDAEGADAAVARAASQMGRTLDTADLAGLLQRGAGSPHWEAVAARCLTCANCTMVCPTCFCTTVEDVSDLTGEHAERWRKWDSCFTMDFSYIHGGSVRASGAARYRQWMTHKLSTWFDQFGSSGCVGCGRCIAWCPVGIDITEEARAIRALERPPGGSP